MRRPEFVTFTGVDDWTDVNYMVALSRRFPIEWAILLSPSRQGTDDPRYPGPETLSKVAWATSWPRFRLAAHLCGGHSRAIVEMRDVCDIPIDLGVCDRIQINHPTPIPSRIVEFRKGWGPMRCIAQTQAEAFPDDARVDWLCDASGGRGVARESWPRHPGGDRLVGYAGGLNPDNVREAIARIDSSGPFWIDMETGVRTDNRFDLSLCERACNEVFQPDF